MKMLFAIGFIAVTVAASTAQANSKRSEIRSKTDTLISHTWYMQNVIGTPLAPTNRSYRYERSIPYLRWVRIHWRVIHRQVSKIFHNPPHFGEFLCIHRLEGAWNSDTGNGYYGGLQMDLGFQRSYGGFLVKLKGTADRWTPLEQIWVAEKATRTRGFGPWPNTAAYCGLI